MSQSLLFVVFVFVVVGVVCCQKSGEKEQELTSLGCENKGSKIQVFAVVDLEYQFTFAFKVQYIALQLLL